MLPLGFQREQIFRKMQTERKIQIGTKRENPSKFFAKTPMPRALKPQLILGGNWLENAGFFRGEIAFVEVRNKQLIITVA